MTECEVLQHAEWYQKFNQLKQEEQHYMKCFQNDLQKQPITHKCISRKMRSKSCPPVARKFSKFKVSMLLYLKKINYYYIKYLFNKS